MKLMSELWYNRTELEKALILILVILVPIILMLAALYIRFYVNQNDIYLRPSGLRSINSPENTPNETVKPSKDLVKRSISICNCPEILNNTLEPYKLISSVSETIFEDDPNEYKFKCSAVLVTETYILTYPKCLSANSTFKIRSSSQYWSKNGFTRKILQYVDVNNAFTIVKLAKPLPNDGFSVKLVEFSNYVDVKTVKEFFTYRWNSKFTSVFKQRTKFDKLIKIPLSGTRCTFSFEGFCTSEARKIDLNDYLDDRDPIFEIKTNKLIGIEVQRHIWADTIEHYYNFIKNGDIKKYIL